MIIYRNKESLNIIQGSEFKININMDPIDGNTMSNTLFKCIFSCGDKSITLDKDDMIQVNDDNYVAPLNSSKLGIGSIKIRYEVDIPDEDFDDGYRHEIAIIDTGINIVKP